MVIYFEGLSCAGKTTLLNAYTKKYDTKVTIIPEFLHYPDKSKIDFSINNEYCLKNDLEKADVVSKSSKSEIVLVDRGYPSTLAYNYIMYKMGNTKDYEDIRDWYFENIIKGKLVKPDLYVYLELNEKSALQRAYKSNAEIDKYAWYSTPQNAIDFYESFFAYFEPDVKMIRLDATKDPETLADELHEILVGKSEALAVA